MQYKITMDFSSYYSNQNPRNDYYDKRSNLPREEYFKKLGESNTIYVGEIPLNCSDVFLVEFFSLVAPIKRIKVGVNKRNFNFCGFCFVEYFNRTDAQKAVDLLNDHVIGEKRIKIDFDLGFYDGREYGRGRRGGQAEEEKRNDQNRPDSFKNEFRNKFENGFKRPKYT